MKIKSKKSISLYISKYYYYRFSYSYLGDKQYFQQNGIVAIFS